MNRRDLRNRRFYRRFGQNKNKIQNQNMQKNQNFSQDSDQALTSDQERIKTLKVEVSRILQLAMVRRGFDQKQLAQYVCTSESCISKVCNYKTNEYTLSQVFDYLARIEPHFQILISISTF